jgi:conjugal transfer pilus assembly protein TraW
MSQSPPRTPQNALLPTFAFCFTDANDPPEGTRNARAKRFRPGRKKRRLIPYISAAFFAFMAAATAVKEARAESPEASTKTLSNPAGACAAAPKANEHPLIRHRALGPVYKPAEENLLEAFFAGIRRMQATGEYGRRLKAAKDGIKDDLANPRAVDLPASAAIRRWAVAASVPETLPEVFAKQNKTADEILGRIARPLLFIDAKSPDSRKFLREWLRLVPESRIVLTRGSVADTSRALNTRLYFDQMGGYTRLFGIQATPAVVFQSALGPEGIEFPAEDLRSVLPLLSSGLRASPGVKSSESAPKSLKG